MLKKLLSLAKAVLQKKKKSASPLKPKAQQLLNNGASPNLLAPVTLPQNTRVKGENVPFVIILTVCFILTTLLFVNFFFDKRLFELKNTRDVLISYLRDNKHIEDRIIVSAEKIDLYKLHKDDGEPLSLKLQNIKDACIKYSVIESITYDRTKNAFFLRTTASSATSYAYLINALLKQTFIVSITLNSVNLDTGANVFVAEFEIKNK